MEDEEEVVEERRFSCSHNFQHKITKHHLQRRLSALCNGLLLTQTQRFYLACMSQ
jgi:hypothetical protein